VDELLIILNKSYEQPPIWVEKIVKEKEEILDGTVAMLTPNMQDALCHVFVRPRNSNVSIIFQLFQALYVKIYELENWSLGVGLFFHLSS
jgi:hypothetical protein